MAGFQHIIEPEPEPEPEPEVYTAGPKGRATIIRGPGKCKRLHFDGVRVALGVTALGAVCVGAGHALGLDALLTVGGMALLILLGSLR